MATLFQFGTIHMTTPPLCGIGVKILDKTNKDVKGKTSLKNNVYFNVFKFFPTQPNIDYFKMWLHL